MFIPGVQAKRFNTHRGISPSGTPCSLKSAAVAGSFHFRVRVWTINQPQYCVLPAFQASLVGRFRFAAIHHRRPPLMMGPLSVDVGNFVNWEI